MENQTSTVLPFCRPYTNINVYSIVTILQFFGIIFNILYIYIAPKDKQKQTSCTLIAVCIIQIGQAFVTLAHGTFIISTNEMDILLEWFPIFETLDFTMKIFYICFSVTLNTARFIVIKNIKSPPENNTRVQWSKFTKWLPFPIVLALSLVYGILSFLNISHVSVAVFLYSLKVFTIGLAWIIFLAVTLTTSLYLAHIVYSRNSQSDPEREQHRFQHNITSKLLKQVIHSLLFQIMFMVVPYTYVAILNMIPVGWLIEKGQLKNQELFYTLVQAILPTLNPLSLGVLLKDQRIKIATFLNVQRISNIFTPSVRIYPVDEPLETIHETEVLQTFEGSINELSTNETIICDTKRRTNKTLSHYKSSITSFNSTCNCKDPMFYSPCAHQSETKSNNMLAALNEENVIHTCQNDFNQNSSRQCSQIQTEYSSPKMSSLKETRCSPANDLDSLYKRKISRQMRKKFSYSNLSRCSAVSKSNETLSIHSFSSKSFDKLDVNKSTDSVRGRTSAHDASRRRGDFRSQALQDGRSGNFSVDSIMTRCSAHSCDCHSGNKPRPSLDSIRTRLSLHDSDKRCGNKSRPSMESVKTTPSLQYSISMISTNSMESTIQDTLMYF